MTLKLKQYKNDLMDLKIRLVLKLPRFFLAYSERENCLSQASTIIYVHCTYMYSHPF